MCLAGEIQYQWRANGNVIVTWGSQDSIQGPVTQDVTVRLEVRCSTEHSCYDFVDVDIDTYDVPTPVITPSPTAPVCPGNTVPLTLTNSGDYEWYQWDSDPEGGDGDDVADTPTIMVDYAYVGYVYNLQARTADQCLIDAAPVTIVEKILAPPVIDPDDYGLCPGQWKHFDVVGSYTSCHWTADPDTAPGHNSNIPSEK